MRKVGIFQILASGICFGSLGLFGKYAYSAGLTPGEILGLRFTTASLILFTYLIFTDRTKLKLKRTEVAACLALGSLGYAVFSSFYFFALQGLSASLTVLLLYQYPILVAIGAWFLFGEKIPTSRIWVFPLVLIGLVGLVWGEFVIEKKSALIFGIGSAVFYSVYILASSRWLKNVSPLASVALIQIAAGLTLSFLYIESLERLMYLITHHWVLILCFAIVPSVFAMTLFNASLQKLKTWEVSILGNAEPISAILLAALFLGERPQPLQMLGGIAVLLGLIALAIPQKKTNS